jgi:YVTN family beta-propeller protein
MQGVNGLIAKYDIANYSNLGEFTSNLSPSDIVVTADGSKGYITDNTNLSNKIGIFDPIGMKMIKTISSPLITEPLSAAISPDGKYAYICGKRSDNILRINISNDSVISNFVLGADVPNPVTSTYAGKYDPQKVVISSDSKKMYVTCLNTSEVVVFDLIKDSIVARIPTPLLPLGAALTPDGSELWTVLYGSNGVDVISTATNQVIAEIDSVSQYPNVITFTPDGAYAYIACELAAGGVHHHGTGGLPPSSYVVVDTKTRKIISIEELPAISVGIVTGYKN